MPVIKCPSCNSMISSKASLCPKCGCAIDGERIFGEPKVYGPPPPITPQVYGPPNPDYVNRHPSDNQLFRCPECGQSSDSIKQYELPHFWLFIGIYLRYQNVQYICCPHCMRKHILVKGFTYNIITANVFWLFGILPWMIVQFIRSYTRGHSNGVKEIINSNN